MHPYVIDSDERRRVTVLITLVAVITAWVYGGLLEIFQITVSRFIDSPAVLAFASAYYLAFDKWLWKYKWLRSGGLVKVPDLEGEWTGHIKSNWNDFKTEIPSTITVYQTWTHMLIIFKTDQSRSDSITATVFTTDPSGCWLSYEYRNTPRMDAKTGSMAEHPGNSRIQLCYKNGLHYLEGTYYSGSDRKTQGTMYFERTNV